MKRPSRLAFRAAVVACVCVTLTCDPEFFPLYDLSASGYVITQTFGQLVHRNAATVVADFAVLKVPAGAEIRTMGVGTIRYRANFHGLGPSLILTPSKYLSSDTDFDPLEGLPRPASIQFAFGNLIESEVEDKMEALFTSLGNSDPSQAATQFIANHRDNSEVDVVATANLATNTVLGLAKDDSLYLAAFTGDIDAPEEFVNPLPFLVAGIPSALRASFDNAAPVIQEVSLYTDDDPAMAAPSIYDVPADGIVRAPNVLFGHVAVLVKIDEKVSPTAPNVAIYELSYEINQVTRDPNTGNVNSRVLRSSGRHLANRIAAAAPPVETDLYSSVRSSALGRTFWYRLHFDPTSPPVATPEVRNYTTPSGVRSINVSAFTPGEYEILIKARDVVTPIGTPVTRAVYARIDNSPGAIASARWKLKATFGAVPTVEVDRSDQTAFLIIPGGTPPLNVTSELANAPVATAPAVYRAVIRSNGTQVNPTASLPLFPAGNSTYSSPRTLPFSATGLHELVVWLDQNGDDVQDAAESSRRIVIMTYQVTLTITASRKHLGAAWAAHAVGTVIPSADGLRLDLSATGFQPGHETQAVYSWEVTTPAGPVVVPSSQRWEADPLGRGGAYDALAVVTLFGVRFEQTFQQIVVGATITPVDVVCEQQVRPVPITVIPSPLPAGPSMALNIELGPPATAGNAVFVASGGAATTTTTTGPVEVRGDAASSARDQVAVVAKYDGAEIAREAFSVCGIGFLDRAGNPANDSLQIARWETAYSGAPFAVRNTAADNFITRDVDRFVVRVQDPSKDAAPGVQDAVLVEIGTLFSDGSPDDDLTQIRLFETGVSTGIFDSPSQMLMSIDLPVADKPDDDFRADDSIAGDVADNVLNDRTHRATVGGRLRVRYELEPGVYHAAEHQICRGTPDQRRRLFLRVHVFNEPFNDLNGNGAHDAGETFVDISAGAVVFGVAGVRGPIVTDAAVQQELERAHLAWAQACIEVRQPDPINRSEAPTRVIGGVPTSIFADGVFDRLPGADEAAVVAAFAPGAHVDTVVVFFGAPMPTVGVTGLSRTPSDMIAGMGENTFIYVNPNVNVRFRTLAHEIGHALDNAFDAPSDPIFFYPYQPTVVLPLVPMDNAVNQQRRIAHATETNARRCRTPGAMAAPSVGWLGNRVLKRASGAAACP